MGKIVHKYCGYHGANSAIGTIYEKVDKKHCEKCHPPKKKKEPAWRTKDRAFSAKMIRERKNQSVRR